MGIFDIFKKKDNKPAEVKTPVYEAENKPKRIWETKHVRVDLVDGILKKMDIERDENDDFKMKKKDLLDEYMDGDKIWKYEPYEFKHWRIDGTEVYVKDDYGDEYMIGTVPAARAKEILAEQPNGPDIMLFGGKYKEIDDDEIITDETDPHIVIEYEKLKKEG